MIVYSKLLSAGKCCSLYSLRTCKLLTDQPVLKTVAYWTRGVIPGSWWSDTDNRCLSCPHAAAWLARVSIGFIWSPVLVGRKRTIRPIEILGTCFILEANPNLFDRWRFLSCKSQHKVVFILAGDFNQFCPGGLAEFLGVHACLDWGRGQITKAVVHNPARLLAALIKGAACHICDFFSEEIMVES